MVNTPDTNKTLRERFLDIDFSRTSSNEWYNSAPGDAARTSVRDAFIADESIVDPAIEYSLVHSIPYVQLEGEYLRLLDDAQLASDDVVYEQAARKLAEMYRHKEVRRRLAGDAINEALSIHRAEYMNEELFGEIEQQDFDAVFSRLHDSAAALSNTLPQARELTELVGSNVEVAGDVFDFELQPETLELLRSDLFEVIPGLEKVLAPAQPGQIDAVEAAEWSQKILDVTGMTSVGWRAVVAKGKAASTSKKDKLIKYGEERVFKSAAEMNKTNVHETIGHGYRSYMASKQEDPRLRGSMPGTLAVEEGGATVLEQIISGVPRRAGQRYLQALGFGKGLDRGGQPRSFRETYEVLYRSLMIEQAASGQEVDLLTAQRKAYQECMRTRRGGALDARDISYFNGAKKINPWFNQIARLPEEQRRESLRIFLSGQFDPMDEAQAKLFGLNTGR